MKRRILVSLILIALIAVPSALRADDAAEPGLSARAFQMRYKEADRAAAAIKSLLSAEGSISIQPARGALVVTDHPENLKRIAEVISRLDAPARQVELRIRLISAAHEANPKPVPAELQEISRKLSGVFRFNSFAEVGSIVATGSEGDPVVLDIDGNYRASFRIGEYDAISDSIRIQDFRLDRVLPEHSEGETLLKTTLNLRFGQTVVLGASRQPQSQKALMLVMAANSMP